MFFTGRRFATHPTRTTFFVTSGVEFGLGPGPLLFLRGLAHAGPVSGGPSGKR